MPELIVYTTNCCPKCKQLMAYLTSIKQPYQEANLLTLLEDANVMTDLHMAGITFKAAPVMQVGDSYFGPEQMFSEGRLDEKKLERLL